MSSFDSLYVACPHCGQPVEFQSKAGKCEMKAYSEHTVPASVAGDLIGQMKACPACGSLMGLTGRVSLWPYRVCETMPKEEGEDD